MARAADGALHVWLDGRDVRVERAALAEPEQHARRGAGAAAAGVAHITAPMPGAVLRLAVAEGDEVGERDVLLVLEAMKMEHPVWAPFAGRVVHVACREGQQVAAGDSCWNSPPKHVSVALMHERNALGRLSGLALAGVVVAIFAVGLARGQDDWHAVLVLVGALLQVLAVVYATRSIWLAPLLRLRRSRQLSWRARRRRAAARRPHVHDHAGGRARRRRHGDRRRLLTLAGNLLA